MAKAEAWVMIPVPNENCTGWMLDMHPLVTCKDCKHYNPERGMCANGHVHGSPETWYCADGERKETNEENQWNHSIK